MKKKLLLPLLLVFITALFSYPFLLNGKLPIPSDAIDGLYHPYRDFFAKEFPQGYPFKNFLITDPMRQQYPWREMAIHEFSLLQLPLWNPYNGAGEPLLANIQSGTFYPFNIFFSILPFQMSWSIMVLIQPLLAGLFLYWYLIHLRTIKSAAFFGAIIYAFCGFMTAWFEWGTIGHTILWLPLILLAIDKLFAPVNQAKFSHIQFLLAHFNKSEKLLVWDLLFILSLSFALFAGHLQSFFYLFLVSIGYFFARWVQYGRSKQMLVLFMALIACFALLTIVQWLPTLQLIINSARDIDQFWHKEGWFIPWQHLIQFLAPDFFGNPSTQNYWGTWNYGEMVGYVGVGSLIAALYALFFRKDRKTLFFGTIFFLSLIFALPTFFAQMPFLLQIPLISTSQPTRLLFLTDFSLAILAALGIDYYLRQKKKQGIIYPIIFIAFLYGLLWLYIFKIHTMTIPLSPEHLAIAKRNLLLPTILCILFSILFVCYAFISQLISNQREKSFIRKYVPHIFVGLIIIITLVDLIRFDWKFNPFTESRLLFPQTKTIAFLSDQSKTYPWRYLGVDHVPNQKRILPPNLSAHDRLYTLDTYNPLLLRRYQEFIAVSEWRLVDIPEVSFNRAIIPNNYKSKLVDFLGVKYIVTVNDTKSKKLKYLFNEGETRVYENTSAFPRAFMVYHALTISDKKAIARTMISTKTDLRKTAIVEEPLPISLNSTMQVNDTVSVNSYGENRIDLRVRTDRDGLLVLTDTFYPTWHVKIDGKEGRIYRTNYAFRGIVIPRGDHHITFYNSLL